MSDVAINAPNLWRLETPGHAGWQRTAHADDPNKYFIVSTDSHANEPPDLWEKRIEPQYRERVPRIITDDKGVQWRYCEGYRPDRVRVMSFEGEDWVRSRAGADVADRIRDNRTDGVDVEIIFPNKGLAMWATPDPVFANAQCRVWNDWAWEQFGPHPESHAAGRLDRHRRSARRDGRDRAGREAGVPRAVAAVQADLGRARRGSRQLQPAALRSDVGADPGSRPADHVPRLDRARSARGARQWRGGDQLRDPLAVADHRAGGESVRVRRAGAVQGLAVRHHRGGHRLDSLAARRDG